MGPGATRAGAYPAAGVVLLDQELASVQLSDHINHVLFIVFCFDLAGAVGFRTAIALQGAHWAVCQCHRLETKEVGSCTGLADSMPTCIPGNLQLDATRLQGTVLRSS